MDFDVIVIGGGHAGTEAAAMAARRGARTALVSFDPRMIGAMSCNPAIGGIGKGHLVREVDAFDGLIARAADAAGLHYRMLNRSKGVAVQGPRVQADRRRYAAAIRSMLATQPGLTTIAGEAVAIDLRGGRVSGVTMESGDRLTAAAVVLATGTFLGGRIYRGEERENGGRVGERAATGLGKQLRALDLPMARLKTGTPPRLDGRTIDWAALPEQRSDDVPWTMSPLSPGRVLPQLSCAITRTTAATHDIIRRSLDRSPLFTGAIEAAGPRYCPSIEDKVHRFGDRDGHQIFLEPEGIDNALVYPNGISNSLPVDVQEDMIASVAGLRDAHIVTPGYAVEYDHIDPRALDRRLALAAIPGVFLAGQINGTTGYEEAAGQGLLAGANAAAHALDLEPLILEREDAYIGVMVDDLVLQGVTEPYRMLTARAEFRLRLRADNAETRLEAIAERMGGISAARRAHWRARGEARAHIAERLRSTMSPSDILRRGGAVGLDGAPRSVADWLRADINPQMLFDDMACRDAELLHEMIEDARYQPYVDRQRADAKRLAQSGNVRLSHVDYDRVRGLSNEMIERLNAAKPRDLAEASRIRGISPAALTAMLLHVKQPPA